MKIPFIGGAYEGRSLNLNAQVCQNWYPISDKEKIGSKSALALMGVPGLTEWKNTGIAGEVRAMYYMNNYLYAVVGSSFIKIDSAKTQTSIGSVSNASGAVWIRSDGTNMMICDGTNGYSYNGTTFAIIADADFPGASSMTYQDGYYLVSVPGTAKFQISDLRDPTSWDATMFATKEANPDNLVCIHSFNQDVWLLGERTIEIWYNSGNVLFPFERYSGGTINIGLGSLRSVSSDANNIFFLDHNFQVRKGAGVQTEIISNQNIDYQIRQLTNLSSAVGFCYTQEGHSFYQITIGAKTLVYDSTTQFWHTRASGITDARHPAQCYCYFDNRHLVGHYSNGKILEFDMANYTIDNDYMRAIRSCQHISHDQKRLFFSQLVLDFETGVGLTVNHPVLGTGLAPQAMLQWSDDGGHTWSNEHWTSLGAVGAYGTRAVWRRLGQARDRVFRVIISDPVKRTLIGANLDAIQGTK
jgi:hypothetical protein